MINRIRKNFVSNMFRLSLSSQGHNFYKLKYISLEEVKTVPFQQ